MTDIAKLDDVRRRMVENHKASKAAAEARDQSPEWQAYQRAREAWEGSDAGKLEADLSLDAVGLEEELAVLDAQHIWSCEFCGCPLFSGDKIDEPVGDEVHICQAAAYEDATQDCPGKRLGLIGVG